MPFRRARPTGTAIAVSCRDDKRQMRRTDHQRAAGSPAAAGRTGTVAAGAIAALLLTVDPFTLLAPAIQLSIADRRALARGDTISRTLDGGPQHVAVFAMSRIAADGGTLIASARAIENLKRSRVVTAIRRFSDPPALSDLDDLVLTPRDIDAALACRVGACSFKLSAPEIGLLRDEIAAAAPNDRRQGAQQAFRRVLLARVNAYQAGGLAGLAPIVNRGAPFCLDQVLQELVTAGRPLPAEPCTTDWLTEKAAANRVESFIYWSQEYYGAGKPAVIVTHVGLVPPAAPSDPAIVLGKQIFASRYMTGGMSLTAVAADGASGDRYLLYVNRTGVDLLGGMFGPIKRAVLESRLRREVPEIIGKLRTRLEVDDARSRSLRHQ